MNLFQEIFHFYFDVDILKFNPKNREIQMSIGVGAKISLAYGIFGDYLC